jgi:hypothetical protein
VTGWWKGYIEGELELYSLLNVLQMNRWRGTRWAENVADMGEKGNYKAKYQTESSFKWITSRVQSVEWAPLAPVELVEWPASIT